MFFSVKPSKDSRAPGLILGMLSCIYAEHKMEDYGITSYRGNPKSMLAYYIGFLLLDSIKNGFVDSLNEDMEKNELTCKVIVNVKQ